MKAWIWTGALALAFLAAAPLRAADGDTEPISFTAQAASGWCPGAPVTLSFQVCNTNQFSIQPGRFYVSLEDVAGIGAASCDLQASGNAYQWMLTNDAGAVNPPTHSANWGTAPYAGGYNANLTSAAQCRPFTFNTVLPADLQYGRSYRIVLRSTSNYYGQVGTNCDWISLPFSSCTPSSSASVLQKSVEGTPSATGGGFMLYWLEYDFVNSNNNLVRDVIPNPGGCPLTIIEASPQPYSGAAASIAGNTVTWRVQDANAGSTPPYQAQGKLFVKVQLGASCSGSFSNTAEYNLNGGGWQASNTVTQSGGQSNVYLVKGQYDNAWNPVTSLSNGQQVNYVLEYQFSGSGLRCFDSFNSYTVGSYGGTSGASAFGQWKYSPESAPYSWNIINDGGGEKAVRYPHSPGQYDWLSYDCDASEANGEDTCPSVGAGSGQMMVEADVRIDFTTANGDVGLILRNNGLVGGDPAFREYAVVLSNDPNPTGHLMVQKRANQMVTWPAFSNALVPVIGTWYTIKALESRTGDSSTLYVKAWVRGTPEPAGWMITWADSDASFTCAAAGDGVAWHSGLYGMADVMSYDNFRVFSGSSLNGAYVLDTIPAGIDYLSASPAPNGSTPAGSGVNEGQLRWNFTGSNYGAVGGILYEGTGSFTWSGIVDCSEASSAVNTASMGASSPAVAGDSNTTSLSLSCGTPTFTLTPTQTPAAPLLTATPTRTPSFSLYTSSCTSAGNFTASSTRALSSLAVGVQVTFVQWTQPNGFRVEVQSTDGLSHFILALYDDNAGSPGNLIMQSASVLAVANNNNGFWPSSPYLSPGTYWLVVQADSPNLVFKANATASKDASLAWGAFPTLFPASSAGSPAPLLSVGYCNVGSATATTTYTATRTLTATPTPTQYAGTETFTQTPTLTPSITLTWTPGGSSTPTPTRTTVVSAGDGDTEPISFTAQVTGSWCAGSAVSVSFSICNTNNFSIQPGRFYVVLEDVAGLGAVDCDMQASGNAYQWMMTNDTGAVNPPTHTSNWGTAPYSGGYNANITAAGQCKAFTFNTVLPSDLVLGRDYRIVLKSTSNYYGQTGINCDHRMTSFSADCAPVSFTPTPTPPAGTATHTLTVTPSPSSTSTPSPTVTATRSATTTSTPSAALTQTPTATPTVYPCGTFIWDPCPPTSTFTPTRTPSVGPIPVLPEGRTRIYPSPARGDHAWLALNLPLPGKARLVILDARMRVVLSVEYTLPAGPSAVPVDIKGLRRGIYFYRVNITLEDGRTLRPSAGRFTVLR